MEDSGAKHGPVAAAALTASVMVLTYGLTYHALAARLAAPVSAVPIARESLERFPLRIADWVGEDLPMDEAIVKRAGAQAHINRRYSRGNGLRPVSLFVGCTAGASERILHPPEVCYAGVGWTLSSRRTLKLTLSNGAKLPCTMFQFQRGDLPAEKVTVLHYWVVDGQRSDGLSPLQVKLRRLGAGVSYIARIMIVASSSGATVDSAARLVSSFALDSAPSMERLLDGLQKGSGMDECPQPLEGK